MTGEVAKNSPAGLFSHSRDLLCICTAAGRLSWVNAACLRLTGYSESELLALRLADIVHPADAPRAGDGFDRLVAQGFANEVATRLRCRDGSWCAVRWSAVANEARTEFVVIARDMRRERRRAQLGRARTALREVAAEQERLRSDLHDGLLQSLTGISLRLATALRQIDAEPARARAEIESAAKILHDEQLQLRYLIQEMKDSWGDGHAMEQPLEERLLEFGRRIHMVWGVRLSHTVGGAGTIPAGLLPSVLRIIQEAVANAARHGGARQATVQVEVAEPEAVIRISDDGRGFPFHGHFDDAALRAQKKGPAVLKHRVWALGGTLCLESGAAGATLEVRLPLRRPA